MAESDTILQLGIEAAREGNREEARNLFSLLTRQEPDNVQAWLWLAGVADGPEQRRVALERVIDLDPTNEMAVKGLQAMGVMPAGRPADSATTAAAVRPGPAQPLSDEERYAAELDMAFDDYDALPKAERPSRPFTVDADADRPTVRAGAMYSDDEDLVSQRPGPSRLLLVVGVLIAVALLAIFFVIPRFRGGNQTTAAPTPRATRAAATPGAATTPGAAINGTTPLTSTAGVETTQPGAPTPEPAPPAAPPQPTAPPPQPGDVAAAQPAPIPAGTVLSANNWNYTFPNTCAVSCAVVIGKQVGSFTANGVYVHVLVFMANNSGANQPLPADYFVLKDGQNRVYNALPQVSAAFTVPGVNADASLETAIPANGITTSVALMFDVPSGATNLTLFARGKQDQGWQVLNVVP